MKIQKVTGETRPKVYALLRRAFPGSGAEAALVQKLHEKERAVLEWVCIHTNKVIAYIVFTHAYRGNEVCGLHLGPMAVAPDFQRRGVGAELLRFALRQESVKNRTLFVLGAPGYFRRFGFEPCSSPICPFDTNNARFLGLRNEAAEHFTVGYEPEFRTSGFRAKRRR
jgi:putative acetyltransferase